MKCKTLLDLKPGNIAYIKRLDIADVTFKKKLYNLGFLPSNRVELIAYAPFGDPVALKVNNTIIALRKNILKNIHINSCI